jgi:hypothetical protein
MLTSSVVFFATLQSHHLPRVGKAIMWCTVVILARTQGRVRHSRAQAKNPLGFIVCWGGYHAVVPQPPCVIPPRPLSFRGNEESWGGVFITVLRYNCLVSEILRSAQNDRKTPHGVTFGMTGDPHGVTFAPQ